MTVHQLKESLELTVLVEQTTDKKITGCYIGDLLSWAMSRVKAGDVWLTVMGNVNAIAVAALSDAACHDGENFISAVHILILLPYIVVR